MTTIRFSKKIVILSGLVVIVIVVGTAITANARHGAKASLSSSQSGTSKQQDLTSNPPSTQGQDTSSNKTQNQFQTEDLGDLGQPFAEPNLQDHYLIWLGNPYGAQQNPNTVYLMDLNNQQTGTVANTQYNEQAYLLDPQVNKNWVTWIDYGAMQQGGTLEYSIYAMNMNTKKVQTVANFKSYRTGFPWELLRGDELVWSQMSDSGHSLIQECNLVTMKTMTLTTVETDVSPAVYRDGDLLVWEKYNSSTQKSAIEVFDLKSRETTRSLEASGAFDYPKIASHYVVYSPQEQKDARSQLDLFDLKSGKTISVPAPVVYYWDIGDGFITWGQHEDQTSGIYVKTIGDESTSVRLGDGYLPFAFHQGIIWQSMDHKHVYLTKIKK